MDLRDEMQMWWENRVDGGKCRFLFNKPVQFFQSQY